MTTDEDGNEVRKDGTNAVWEAVNQKPLVIPSPKYGQPVVMRPDGYDWRSGPAGVESKNLGHFTEGDLTLSTYRWAAGGRVALGAERTSIVWLAQGSVSLDGRTLGPRTLVFSDYGEEHELVGEEPGAATVIGLPVAE
ncbi:hypothetical protein BJF78_06780 [Pseudonocardia sp. CNS-139]|nr:hypothetical protein BJF78_06780 [Pseudonocardia sp. CNS-139]